MNERIARLVKAARSGEIFPPCVKVEYDEFDLKLADPLRIAKRLSEYMEAQPCYFTEDNELLGMIHFDCSVEADLSPEPAIVFFLKHPRNFIASRRKTSARSSGSTPTPISGKSSGSVWKDSARRSSNRAKNIPTTFHA